MEQITVEAYTLRELIKLVRDMAEDVEGYISEEHKSRNDYPFLQRRYDNDMESVHRIRDYVEKLDIPAAAE